ncbi:hypothetical protein HDV00_004091 [Rhizophlyctis rosea]|nr:hypothetical protein HDV00_004091 [Rhizophlyctis rosea]
MPVHLQFGGLRVSVPIPHLDRTPPPLIPDPRLGTLPTRTYETLLIPLHKSWSKPSYFWTDYTLQLQPYMTQVDFHDRLAQINATVEGMIPPAWKTFVPIFGSFVGLFGGMMALVGICGGNGEDVERGEFCQGFHERTPTIFFAIFMTCFLTCIITAIWSHRAEKKAVEALQYLFFEWNLDDNLIGWNWMTHYDEKVDERLDRDGRVHRKVTKHLCVKLELSQVASGPAAPPVVPNGPHVNEEAAPPPAYSEEGLGEDVEETPFLGKQRS